MRQAEQVTIVSDLKSEILAVGSPDQATIGDRANAANLAALDMLIGGVNNSGIKKSLRTEAEDLRELSRDLSDMTQIIENLSPGKK